LNPHEPNYADSQQKDLLIIGDNGEPVKRRVEYVAENMKGKGGAPEIVGLCVSLNHDSYEMFLEGAAEPLFLCVMGLPSLWKKTNMDVSRLRKFVSLNLLKERKRNPGLQLRDESNPLEKWVAGPSKIHKIPSDIPSLLACHHNQPLLAASFLMVGLVRHDTLRHRHGFLSSFRAGVACLILQ
jgi:hypothetical protein